jgi:hypothetical protein
MKTTTTTNPPNTSLTDAKKYATEACTYGTKIIENLAIQEETLSKTEDTLEANAYAIQQSRKILHSMTWSGLLYNMFSYIYPTQPTPTQPHSQSQSTYSITQTPIPNPANNPTATNPTNTNTTLLDDPDMLDIQQSINQLHNMTITMHDHLSHQNDSIARIQTKTEHNTDATIQILLTSSQIIHKYSQYPQTYIGKYILKNHDDNTYLSVDNHYLVFKTIPDKSSHFHIYSKQHLMAIQNDKTKLFLGVSIFGSICVSGEHWGNRENCYIHLYHKTAPTGILVLAKNWGNGGWITAARNADNTLTSSTSSISDKTNILHIWPQSIPAP